MKRSTICMFGLLLTMLFCTACQASQTSQEPAAEPGTVLFSDDFTDPSNAWGLWNQKEAVVQFHNGGLRILVLEKQYDFWSLIGKNYQDVQIEVDAAKIAGPDDNDFGIICRYQNKNNFYAFLITSDGYSGITKVKNGKYSLIGTDKLQYSPVIAQGAGANHLRADCSGSTLRLYVNGQKLQEVQSEDFTAGDVGLMAGSYDEIGVDILFDRFVVKQP